MYGYDALRHRATSDMYNATLERDIYKAALQEIARDRGYAPNPNLLVNIAKEALSKSKDER